MGWSHLLQRAARWTRPSNTFMEGWTCPRDSFCTQRAFTSRSSSASLKCLGVSHSSQAVSWLHSVNQEGATEPRRVITQISWHLYTLTPSIQQLLPILISITQTNTMAHKRSASRLSLCRHTSNPWTVILHLHFYVYTGYVLESISTEILEHDGTVDRNLLTTKDRVFTQKIV